MSEEQAPGIPDVSPIYGCEMPDLSGLDRPRVARAAWLNVLGAGIQSQPDYVLGLKIIALCDACIAHYEAARRLLAEGRPAEDPGSGWLSDYHAGLAALESCFATLDRALTIAAQLKDREMLAPELETLLPSRKAASRVSSVRNRIEHGDKDISKSRVPEGRAALLYAMRDGVEIGPLDVTYEQLTGTLRSLAAFADELAEHRPT